MDTVQALVLAFLQGVTELFPISSLGHAVLVPALLGWHIDQTSQSFLPFLVVLHLGTAAALLLYFWRDWVDLIASVLGAGPLDRRDDDRHLLLLIVVATIPAAVVGFFLERPLRALFAAPTVAAAFLIVNGVILFAGERARRQEGTGTVAKISWKQAFWIGLWQSSALIPGISRSGATIVAGLLAGLKHEDAARFSFLMATPVIAGAAILEVPKLLHTAGSTGLGTVAAAGILAGVVAFISVAILMRYFRRREIQALDPFAFYCWGMGLLSLAILALR